MSDAVVAPVSDIRGPSENPSPLTHSPSLKRKAAGDASEADDRVEKSPRYGTDDGPCSPASPHNSRPSATPRSSCAPAEELHNLLSVEYHQEDGSQEDEYDDDESDEEVWYPGPPPLVPPVRSSASESKSENTQRLKELELKHESSSHFQRSTIVSDMKGKRPMQSAPMSSYCYPWQSGNSTSVDDSWTPDLAPAVLDQLQSFVRMLAPPVKRDSGCSFLFVDNVGPLPSHVDALPTWPRRGSYGGSYGLYDNVLPIARDECECTICVRALAQKLEQSESLSPPPPKLESVSPSYPLVSETAWSASSKPHDLLMIGVPMPSVESSAHAPDEKSQSVPRCGASPSPVAGPSSQRRGGTRYGSAPIANVCYVLDNVAVVPLPPLQDVVEHHALQMRVE